MVSAKVGLEYRMEGGQTGGALGECRQLGISLSLYNLELTVPMKGPEGL